MTQMEVIAFTYAGLILGCCRCFVNGIEFLTNKDRNLLSSIVVRNTVNIVELFFA